MERIYCYYLDSILRLSEFLVSFESLKATSPKYPIACLVGDEIINNNKLFNFLQELDIILLRNNKPLSEIVYDGNDIKSKWICSGKLELFRFAQFDKIVYLDSDTFIVQNVDELFELPSISMTAHSDVELRVNGGVMVISPSENVANKFLMEREAGIFSKTFKYNFDQDFLSANFTINIMPAIYNTIIPSTAELANFQKSEVKIWHFGTVKYRYEDATWDEITADERNKKVLSQIENYLIYFYNVVKKYREKYPYIPIAEPVTKF